MARKSILKLVKWQSLVANFANFVYFVLYAEICTTFGAKVVEISVRNTKVYKIREICRAISLYIRAISYRILQYFATKLRNFTNFNMLFLAVVMDFVLLA